MVPEPDRFLKVARRKTNPISMPAAGSSILVKVASASTAYQDGARLSHWVDKARRPTAVGKSGIQEDRLFDKPPPVTLKDVRTVPPRRELKTMIEVPVSNVMLLIDDLIISTLKSCTAGSRPSPTAVAVSTAIVTVIGKQIGEKMMLEFVKDMARQTGTTQDVISTTTHEIFGCDEMMAPIARFCGKNRRLRSS